LPHSLLQTNPCIRHNFSTQVFRKRAAQLHYVGPRLRYISCDHRFASQPLANEPLHSSQLIDTSL